MSKIASAVSRILAARSLAAMLQEYDQLFPIAAPTPAPVFGVEKRDGVSIERERREANARALSILDRVQGNPDLLTEDDKAELRRYSGLGGIGGSIHEYYTPQWVAEGIWGLMASMGSGPGNYLEPSSGTGVFHGTKPKGALMTATEIDGTSSQINQLLHPEDRVMNQSFEALAVSAEDDSFDGVVGNVPFGETRGEYGALDPEYADIKYVDQYFVTRMLDKIKPGTLMAVVVPMRIVSGAKFKKFRADISLKAEFLGAHRLPSGTFSNNGTDTATDILVMRKHPEGLADLVNGRKKADLEAANVLWPTFINGKWFETAEGKRFIHGEESTSGQGKFARTVVNQGNITSAQIKERLATKFDSRIDWMALELTEPVTPTYGEGDERLINGRWRRLVNGQWQSMNLVGSDGDSISKETYGVASYGQLKTMLQQSPLNALQLSHDQLMAIHRDFPDATEGFLADTIKMSGTLEPKYRARVIRGSVIGFRIQGMLAEINDTGTVPAETAAELRDLVNQEAAMFGVAAADRNLAALSGGQSAGAWNQFVKATDVNGKFSALLDGTLDRGPVRAFDDTNAADTVAYLFSQLELNPVDLADFADTYRGEEGLTLAELAKVPGVAITPDGMLMPMDRATCGYVTKTSRRLLSAMASEQDPAILANYQAQLDMIETRRHRSKVDDIEMGMVAKWLPRKYVLEFLKEYGYSDCVYSKIVEVDGELIEDKNYQGSDGVWSGYGLRDGKKRTNVNEQFERQLENYLNGAPVRSGDAAGAAAYRERIKSLEEQFGIWLRQHDDIDQLVDLYNDTFNGFVPFDHTDAPLLLEGISGRVEPFGYQSSGVRRLSEDGRGVLAFGTGLGKTATAYSLVAYNIQTGRSKRTAINVPLSMIENWYHEAKTFYGPEFLAKTLFIGVEPVRNKDGEIEQEPVLDDDGEQRTGANGEPLTRDKLRFLDGKEVNNRLNSIPQSNYHLVVMTKEQFASIPMRADSIVAHVDKMEELGLRAGKIHAEAKNYREAMKNEKFAEKHADTGTKKKLNIPYFEDMGFDSVITDEAHNFRNSYQAGRESSKLAYLPTLASAKMALDMAIKNAYLMRKYNGRGPVLLTATPTVNSPIDIFNMLSHVLTPDEWMQLGILDVDDFVRVFGDTEDVMVQKLSGEVESKPGLVGFKNLSGLRSLFHRWVNLKDAKDVSDTVAIPDLDEKLSEADMTDEQASIYESLRQRADALSKGVKDDKGPQDSIFAIIRDMDRVCTDTDLYNHVMTFRFPLQYADAVKKLVADLPASLKKDIRDDDKQDEEAEKQTITAEHNARVRQDPLNVTLIVNELYEQEVVDRLEAFGIQLNTVSHPVTPKYARMLENLKIGYEEGGKQIIFTEEKTQHAKLKRIIVNHLGIPAEQIGIINADTVSGKTADDDLKGLEAYASAYNSGKIKVLICNKKAEVGVNLHMGTTDIHHLTLPWTPASIKQRNGRGARVGSKQKRVRVHYYVGKGSFDQFRLDTLKRKASWQYELFTSDAERMKNADADDAMEASLLLAADPEERQARIEENQAKAKAKIREAATKRANIDIHNYLKAAHDKAGNRDVLETRLAGARSQQSDLQNQIARLSEFEQRYRDQAAAGGSMANWYRQEAKNKTKEISRLQEQLKTVTIEVNTSERKLARMDKADATMKRLRPELERAQKNGLLSLPADMLDQADQYLTDGVKTVKIGNTYLDQNGIMIMKVESLNFDTKTVYATLLYIKYSSPSYRIMQPHLNKVTPWGIGSFSAECTYTPTEIDTLRQMMTTLSVSAARNLLDAGQWTQYLVDGTLQLSTDKHLLHKGADEFEVVYHPSYSEKRMPREQLERIVYPSSLDQSFKAKLAKWLLADRERMSSSSYNNTTAKDYLIAIYGNDTQANIEHYGNNAPKSVINEWLAKALEAYKKTERAQKEWPKSSTGSTDMYSYYFESEMGKTIPSEWDNHADFTAALKEGEKILEAEVKEAVTAHRARENEAAAARLKLAMAEPADSRKERLNYMLTESQTRDARSNGYSWASSVRAGKVASPYMKDDAFAIELALADLVAVGVGRLPANPDRASISDAYNNAMYALVDDAKKGESGIAYRWLNGEPKATEPDPEELVAAGPPAEPAQVIKAMIGYDLPTIPGLTFRINAKAARAGGEKVRTGGGWKTKPVVNYGAGDVIGIHDPQGKNGKLYAKKEQLKATIGAGLVRFAVDLSDEFPGAWWFVPAATSKETLIAVLGGE